MSVGKVVISQQQSAEGSSMTQRRGQSLRGNTVGGCASRSLRSHQVVDCLAVLVCMPESTPSPKEDEVSCPSSEHKGLEKKQNIT